MLRIELISLKVALDKKAEQAFSFIENIELSVC